MITIYNGRQKETCKYMNLKDMFIITIIILISGKCYISVIYCFIVCEVCKIVCVVCELCEVFEVVCEGYEVMC